MEVRGERECQECHARWSYFETGSITCPECGSIRSVGVDERRRHTDRATSLDLSEARRLAGERSLREAADPAEEAAREYIRARGFIHAGELEPLDDTYLAAQELRHAASRVRRALSLSEEEKRYFLSLLEGAPDGDRPDPADVPASMRAARGLATASALRAYRDDLRTWLEDVEVVEEATSVVETLGDHVRRVRALDGDIDPAEAERLVIAGRAVGAYLRTDDVAELERARTALDAVG
ncbi:MAG: TFIIB-type zinc ribbon-containing protein [Halodesulfurarchaeum sp.]